MFVPRFADNLCLGTYSLTKPITKQHIQNRKKKPSERYKEKLTHSTEDFQKNSKTRKDGVSVDFQQKDLETLLMLININ